MRVHLRLHVPRLCSVRDEPSFLVGVCRGLRISEIAHVANLRNPAEVSAPRARCGNVLLSDGSVRSDSALDAGGDGVDGPARIVDRTVRHSWCVLDPGSTTGEHAGACSEVKRPSRGGEVRTLHRTEGIALSREGAKASA